MHMKIITSRLIILVNLIIMKHNLEISTFNQEIDLNYKKILFSQIKYA